MLLIYIQKMCQKKKQKRKIMHGFLGLPYFRHNNNYLLTGISQTFIPCIPIKYYIIFGIYLFILY